MKMNQSWDITPEERSWYDYDLLYDERLKNYNLFSYHQVVSSPMMCVNVKDGVDVYGYFATFKVASTNYESGDCDRSIKSIKQSTMKTQCFVKRTYDDLINNIRVIDSGNYEMFKNVVEMPAKINDTLKSVQNLAQEASQLTPEMIKTMQAFQDTFAADSQTITNLNDTLNNVKKIGQNLDSLQSLLDTLNAPPETKVFSIISMIENIKARPGGFLASFISLARSPDLSNFITNLISILSQLGFEQVIIDIIRDRWTSFTAPEHKDRYENLQDKLPKLISLAITILGPLLLGSNIADFMNFVRKSKKDASTMKEIIEELEDLAEEYGFGWSARSKFVKKLKDDLKVNIEKLAKFDKYLAEAPIRFCRKIEYDEFVKLGVDIVEAIKNLSTKNYTDMIGTAMVAEIRALHQRYIAMAKDVTRIRRTNADRVKPVGIAIYGNESQIGKSNLMSELQKRIRLEMRKRINDNPNDTTYEAFADVEQWNTWNQNIRDKYDQNFQGQEFHAIDDAFSNKEEVEHSSLITFISNRPAPSYQAELNSKGFAYECKVVMVSCNTFPRESHTINNIHALAERFPVFVHAKKREGCSVPSGAVNDSDFNWLELHLSTGTEYFKKEGRACCDDGCYGGIQCSIDNIVTDICDRMYINQKRFDLVQESQQEANKIFNQQKVIYTVNGERVDIGAYEMMNGSQEEEEEFQEPLVFNKQDIVGVLPIVRYMTQYENIQRLIKENPLIIPHYHNIDELPSNVKRGLFTSKSDTHFGTGLCGQGNTFSDFLAVHRISIEEVKVFYEFYKFKPLPRYQEVINNFFTAPAFLGEDDEFFICNNFLYINNVFSFNEINAHEDDYFSLLCPTLSSFFKLFSDPEFIGLGVLFTSLNFIGIPVPLTIIITQQLSVYLGTSWYTYKKGKHISAEKEEVRVNFYVSLFSKFLVVVGFWIVGKILFYMARKSKNLLSHIFWKSHPDARSQVVAFFESDGLEYRHLDLKQTPQDTTCVLVDENGNNTYMFKLFRPTPRLLGSVNISDKYGVKTAQLCCVKDNEIVPSAFIECINQLDIEQAFFSVHQLNEKAIEILKTNGLFKKILCYPKGKRNAYSTYIPTKFSTSKVQSFEYNQVPVIDKVKFLKQYAIENPGNKNVIQFSDALDKLQDKIDGLNKLLKTIPTKPLSLFGANQPAGLTKSVLESSEDIPTKIKNLEKVIDTQYEKISGKSASTNKSFISSLLSGFKSLKKDTELEEHIREKYDITGDIPPFLLELETNLQEVEEEGSLEETKREKLPNKQKSTVRSYQETKREKLPNKQKSTVRKYQTRVVKEKFGTKFISKDYEIDSSEISDFDGEEDYQPTDQETEDIFTNFENFSPITLPKVIKFPNVEGTVDSVIDTISSGNFESAVDPQANLVLESIRKNILVMLVNSNFNSLYGMGIGSHVVFPSHLVQGEGEVISLYRVNQLTVSDEFYYVRVTKYKKEWELACGEICQPGDPIYTSIKPKEQLIFRKDLRNYVPEDILVGSRSLVKFTLQYLPKQGFIIPSMATYVQDYKATLSGQQVETSIYAMRTMPHLSAQSKPGDCGGAVVQLDCKSQKKLIGMHIGSASRQIDRDSTSSYGIVAILTRERIDVLTDNKYIPNGSYQSDLKLKFAESSKYDHFDDLLDHSSESGVAQHLPNNDNNTVIYVGDMKSRQLPCDIKGRTEHHKTPFYGVFDVKKAPSCLIDSQVEDPSNLENDAYGNPSILVTNLKGYTTDNYRIDEKEMSDMVSQLTDHMESVLLDCDITTAKKHKTAMFEALNGQIWNEHFDKINDKTSSGIGWDSCPKKNDFLKEVTVKNPIATDRSNAYFTAKYIKNTGLPLKLQKVFRTKLDHAKRGFRTFSIWKVCIKDEPLPLLKVKIGKSRIFIAPPMESFLMGRYLFGRWKAAFKSKQLDLFHAVGIDMKSLDVVKLVERIKKHPNYIDMDYKNFDQRLLSQFMEAAGTVISTVIFRRENDVEMFNARQTYFNEIIYTLLCAYKTVMLTTHGNKSGNPLTTELNCIVNFLYSWYVFRKVTGNNLLSYYLEHVVDINFGDDKVLAVSDVVIDKFNFFSYQKIMAELGQVITPGNKEGVEISHTTKITDISFLKRKFKQFNNDIWFAPLDPDSIESVFNYCTLGDEDIKEWQVVIQEQLIEAMLWGKDYFKTFSSTLHKYVAFNKEFKNNHPQLRSEIIKNIPFSFTHYFYLFLERVGLLDSCRERKDIINSIDNKGSVDQVHALLYKNAQYESYQQNNNKNLKISVAKIEDTAMHRSKSSINYPGGNLHNLTTRGGMPDSYEVTPEAFNQNEGVQSDIGPPIKVMCSEGMVYAFDLSQTDDAYKEIPLLMKKQMSLPSKLKYMQYQTDFAIGNQLSVHKETPLLQDVCPKARQLMRCFQYHRVNKMLMRIDCRPPMGYAQTVKVSSTTSADTTASSLHRKGVTYDLADNPKMYFIVPFSDREYAKLVSEPWCSIIFQAITDPVATITNPTPLRARISYEILDMEFFVDRNVDVSSTLTRGNLNVISTGNHPSGNQLTVNINSPTYVSMSVMSTAAPSTGASYEMRLNGQLVGTILYVGGTLQTSNPWVLLQPGSYPLVLTVVTGPNFINTTPAQLSWFTEGAPPTVAFSQNVGRYECDEHCEKPSVDFVSLLKEEADKDQSEVKYDIVALPSEPHLKVYSVTCRFKQFSASRVSIGKSAAKQCSAAQVYAEHIASEVNGSDGQYEMEATFDSSSATPAVAMDTRPPVGQAHTRSNLAMDQTVGTVSASLDITRKTYVPIQTYNVTSLTNQILKFRQHPGNWTSFGQESQAQAELRPYVLSGPTECNGIPSYGHYKLTGAGNFQQNFRAVIAQAPMEYTAADIDNLSIDQVSQLPRIEYFLHGGECYFTPQWVNRLATINHRLTDYTNTNGWLVIRILENALSDLSTTPKVTLWVCADNVSKSLNSQPVTPPPVLV